MFKYLLNKTIFKDLTDESKELAYKRKGYNIKVFYLAHLAPLIPVFLLLATMLICMNVDQNFFGTPAYTALDICLSIILVWYVLKTLVFHHATKFYIADVANLVIYLTKARRGEAIKKRDFKALRKERRELHHAFRAHLGFGHCYSICFALLDFIKEGEMKFIAVGKFSALNPEEDEVKEDYTMHVIYIRDGWVYDSNMNHQYKVEQVEELYGDHVYKTFRYEDIEGLEYEDFLKRESPAAKEWCREHNCYCGLDGEEDSDPDADDGLSSDADSETESESGPEKTEKMAD